jgi:hypothetical protein
LENAIRTQGPGVIEVELHAAGAGEIAYKVKTKADAAAFADWLGSLKIEGKKIAILGVEEDRISAKVK